MHDDAIFSWQVQLSSFNITLPSMSVVCFSSLIISGIRFTILDEYLAILNSSLLHVFT